MRSSSWVPNFPHISYVPAGSNGGKRSLPSGHGQKGEAEEKPPGLDDHSLTDILSQLWSRYPGYLTAAIVGLITMFTATVWMCGRQVHTYQIARSGLMSFFIKWFFDTGLWNLFTFPWIKWQKSSKTDCCDMYQLVTVVVWNSSRLPGSTTQSISLYGFSVLYLCQKKSCFICLAGKLK